MQNLFQAKIVTQDRVVYTGKVSSMVAPGELGYLGVLANHAPLMSSLVSGKITLREGSGRVVTFYSKGRGYLEVFKNNVTLLMDDVEAPESS